MIKNIFLPEKLGNVRLIPKTILGISLDEKNIKFAKVFATKSKTQIQNLKSFSIEKDNAIDYSKRVSASLQTALNTIGNFDDVYISIPASIVIFKEIKLPLKNTEKIRLVVENEIEPMLPFSTDDAIIDFIITRQEKDENDTQILVAATQKKDLEDVLNIYKEAGISPKKITIDLFAIYDLYQQIPEYKNIKNGSAIIETREHFTQIAFLQDGELRLIRNIPKGTSTVIKAIIEEIKQNETDIVLKLQQQGIEETDQIIQKHFINFLHDIQFTLNSFSLKIGFYKEIEKILFNYSNINIKNFDTFATNVLGIDCKIFDTKKILKTQTLTNTSTEPLVNWHKYTIALGTALPSPFHNEFNLRRKTFALYEESLVRKQIKTACGLTAIMLISMITFGFLQIKSLSSQVSNNEQTEVNKLKKVLLKTSKQTEDAAIKKRISRALKLKTLPILTKQTNTIVETEEKAWGQLTKLSIPSLKILSELTKIINREKFHITIKEISIFNDRNNIRTIDMLGYLKSKTGNDFQDFDLFDKSLKKETTSNLLTLVESDSSIAEEEEGGGAKFTLNLKEKEM